MAKLASGAKLHPLRAALAGATSAAVAVPSRLGALQAAKRGRSDASSSRVVPSVS